MKNLKNIIFYVGVTGGALALMYVLVQMGTGLEAGRNIRVVSSDLSYYEQFMEGFRHNLHHPLAVILMQIATIIVVARTFGWLMRRIGQPAVIGEIIAGIALGPSLLGAYFPEVTAVLFPTESFNYLQVLSQVGLVLFMFIIGMELDLNVLRRKAQDAVVVSHASIVIPFTLGMVLAYLIYDQFAPPHVGFLSFALFIGIAMSITAFPVLARIVQERGLHKTRLGTMVITCAAADDVTAWSLLAAVIAVVKAGSFTSALYTIVMAVGYVLTMIYLVRPFLHRIGETHASREQLSMQITAIFFTVLIASAYATEIIGIHALFGAFMAGAIMPENKQFKNIFITKVEDVSVVLLLPLFFVYTGLRTQIGLLNSVDLWIDALILVSFAVVGKFAGSALSARFVGQTWRESLTIGALMNTRGLMELVVLNIGYDLGVLGPEIFAMMVIMALSTTFMTSPLLDLIDWIWNKKDKLAQKIDFMSKFRVVLSFGNPERGRTLLRIAHGLIGQNAEKDQIVALHLSPVSNLNNFNISEYEHQSFVPVLDESAKLGTSVTTEFQATENLDNDIVYYANQEQFSLLLMGIGQSIYEGSLLGKILNFGTQAVNPERVFEKITGKERIFDLPVFDQRTQYIVSHTKASVGVLIDKNFQKTDFLLIPIFGQEDKFLLDYAKKFIKNADAQVVFIDMVGALAQLNEFREAIRSIERFAPNHVTISKLGDSSIDLQRADLVLVNVRNWRQILENHEDWKNNWPSVLIIKE